RGRRRRHPARARARLPLAASTTASGYGAPVWLYLADVRGLQPFRTAVDVELDLIALSEALEALPLDGGVMHEHVLAALLRDEAEALRVVEPLHSSRCHD